MREAPWTVSPQLERETAALRRREARVARAVGIGTMACLGATLALPLASYAGVAPFETLLVLHLALLVGTAMGVRFRNELRETPDPIDLGMRSEFGGGLGWLVEMVVRRGDAPTGADRGMVWFEDGQFLFAGRRTSFTIAPRQVFAVVDRERARPGRRGAWTLRLRADAPGDPLSISVRPLVGLYPRKELGSRLGDWVFDAIPVREGSLPPLEVGPGAPSPAPPRGSALVVGLLGRARSARGLPHRLLRRLLPRNAPLSRAAAARRLVARRVGRGDRLACPSLGGLARPEADRMSEAEWTVVERAELARDRREGFVLSPAFFGGAKLQTATAVGLGGLFGLYLFGAVFYGGLSNGMVFFALALFSLGSIPLAWHWERRQEARRAAEPEMRMALGHDGRLVSLLVRQGDAPTGEDWGMLWFEEGRLYFSGRRTSFGLVPEQARGLPTVDEAARGIRHRLNLPLGLDRAAGPVSLSFEPFVAAFANRDVAMGALRVDLDRWTQGRAWGVGQWPPTALGPCVVTERALLGRALANSVGVPLFPCLVLLGIGAPIVALAAFLLGMAMCSLAGPNALVWRAWWARRRLRRSA